MVESNPTQLSILFEEWRDVPSFEGLYSISNYGRLRRDVFIDSTGRQNGGGLLKASPTKSGYRRTSIYSKGKKVTVSIHALVALVFIGPCPERHEVNHKNGIKTDNRSDNLEYRTAKGNTRHAIETGLRSLGKPKPNPRKLTSEKVIRIRADYANGATTRQLAGEHNCSIRYMRAVVSGRVWKALCIPGEDGSPGEHKARQSGNGITS